MELSLMVEAAGSCQYWRQLGSSIVETAGGRH